MVRFMGTPVSDDRVDAAFDADVEIVLSECKVLYPDFDDLPEEVQQIIANMMFNLGRPRLSKFRGMKRGVDSKIGILQQEEMVDSRWYAKLVEEQNVL